LFILPPEKSERGIGFDTSIATPSFVERLRSQNIRSPFKIMPDRLIRFLVSQCDFAQIEPRTTRFWRSQKHRLVRHVVHAIRACRQAGTGPVPGYFSSATAGERKLGFGKWAYAISFSFYLHLVSHKHGVLKKKGGFSSELCSRDLRHKPAHAAQKPFTVDRTSRTDRVLTRITRIPPNSSVAGIIPCRTDVMENQAAKRRGATVAVKPRVARAADNSPSGDSNGNPLRRSAFCTSLR
jgi:hypothetical protein